ncbi:hypothetical protein ACETRX_08335 [Labrys portucalensis]|uniref:Uncharacterized protein n=1 Tax=Labrys neptuniae TaxID=376174 RepID=A0ABV6ZBP8_9HYPH
MDLRDTANVIDARQAFLDAEFDFICRLPPGYAAPTSGGSPPADLSAFRQAKAAASQSSLETITPPRSQQI